MKVRFLVTADKDFGMLAVRAGYQLHGLVLLRYSKLTSKSTAVAVAATVQRRANMLGGYLTVLSEKEMRRRALSPPRT